jgi:hypothetical protein
MLVITFSSSSSFPADYHILRSFSTVRRTISMPEIDRFSTHLLEKRREMDGIFHGVDSTRKIA